MNRVRCITAMLVIVFSAGVFAQAPPGTDIYLAELTMSDGNWGVGATVNVTRRPGYDNQPFFLPGGGILYTSMDTTGQTDIFRYDLAGKSPHQVTHTAESEYSPTPMIGVDRFSVVRVEGDQRQRLWSFAMDGTDPKLLLERVEPVGYHAWITETTVGLFVLGDVFTLRLGSIETGNASEVAGHIGRSLHKVPGRQAVSFNQQVGEEWWIQIWGLTSMEPEPVLKVVGESQDYAWTPDGSIIMADGGTVFVSQPGEKRSWTEITSLKLNNITRLAVSPDGKWLALVAEDPDF